MLLRHGEKEKENPTLEASRKQHKKSFQDDQFNKNVLFYRSRSSIIHTYKHIMHIRGCNPLYMLQTISSNCHKNHFLSWRSTQSPGHSWVRKTLEGKERTIISVMCIAPYVIPVTKLPVQSNLVNWNAVNSNSRMAWTFSIVPPGQTSRIHLPVLFVQWAVYSSSVPKTPSFERSGIDDNWIYKRLMTTTHHSK